MLNGIEISASVLSAFLIAFALVPVLALPARQLGLTDQPDHRKRHRHAVPLTGGLAMFIAFLVAVSWHAASWAETVSLLAGMTVLLIIGVIDDRFDVRASFKLMVQFAVAAMAVVAGDLELVHLG